VKAGFDLAQPFNVRVMIAGLRPITTARILTVDQQDIEVLAFEKAFGIVFALTWKRVRALWCVRQKASEAGLQKRP
jgi:hypothetical protein